MKKIITLLVMLNLFQQISFSQDQHLVDSLKIVLKKAHEDTAKVKAINSLAQILVGSSPDTAIYLANTALNLATKLNDTSNIVQAYSILGYGNKCIGNYVAAVDYYQKALTIQNKWGNETGVAGTCYSLGCVSQDQGNFSEALKYYLKGLKIFEENKNKSGTGQMLNNIGLIYCQMNDTSNALNYLRKSLDIYKKLNKKEEIANGLNALGVLYLEQGNYTQFIEYINESLKLFEEIKSKYGVACCYRDIGKMYKKRGEYDLAIKNQLFALALFTEINKKYETAITLIELGTSFEEKGDLAGALKYQTRGLLLAKEIGALDYMRNAYEKLAGIYFKKNNFKDAYLNQVLFKQTYDSIYNKENERKLTQQQMQYDFDKKQVADSLKFAQEKEIGEVKLQKQKALTYGGYAGVLITVVLLFFVYRNYNKQRIANQQLKEAQQQLIKSEKLAAFGVMATRVAHEIQNPLNFVNNFSELSQDVVADVIHSQNEEDKKHNAELLIANLKKINDHGKRAASIINQLQEHSRKGSAHEFFENNA